MSKALDILVVEDNRQNFELVEFLLVEGGFRVRWARDSEEMRHELGRRRPSLVLMDIQLPGVDGLSLVQEMRQDPALRGLLVIALTAHALRGDRERFLRQGFDGYLSKPIDVATFCEEVRAYL